VLHFAKQRNLMTYAAVDQVCQYSKYIIKETDIDQMCKPDKKEKQI
jgi:hypothetical protein